ncbi:class I SAM-dependent methyltransferase [Nocardiopsis chromatogenes]|uniref:class I SAM-dependent methyltransferase n=1 Tax=Nocardiopsis chromatogenes TaxID=280239 RepID=UPI00034D473A|nr:class I SAM-dependent methyltransferase [Nocardiopsis chromatogenes]
MNESSRTTDHLRATADAYDGLADLYADHARGALACLPLDRAVISAFADLVRGAGPVIELGSGSGEVTGHLRDLGLDVCGVDLSPALVAIARREVPGVAFRVGSMGDLDAADGALAGAVSWYSLIHLPPEEVPAYLAEFRRVLAPGGHLLLAFFEAEGGPVAPFDHAVATAYRWPVEEMAAAAGTAGFTEVGRMLREPLEEERFRRGHLLMRADGAPGSDRSS